MAAKRIAIVGSSGGHLFSLGGNNPGALLDEIRTQIDAAGFELVAVQFLACSRSLDTADGQTPSRLILEGIAATDQTVPTEGTLEELNEATRPVDGAVAAAIEAGEIDALILVSADPKGANKQTMEAAANKRIPVVGTGGTAMAQARTQGVNVVAMSGTTGTTNRTRAVGYMAALAKEWGTQYRPVIGQTSAGGGGGSVNFRGIMTAALPAFIAMALSLALGKIPGADFFANISSILIENLPLVVAVIAARQVSGLDDVGVVSGFVVGVLTVASAGGIIGGIAGGVLGGYLAQRLLLWSSERGFPATTANIVAGGISGLVAGFAIFFLIAPISLAVGDGIRFAIEWAVGFSPILAGAIAGILIWPALIAGVYHAAILPLVLLEMETIGHSFLGAIDLVSLLMVSAGITLANIIGPRDRGEAGVAAPGFAINIGFGTFVEAAYPFMFSDRRIFGTALFAATVGGAAIGVLGVRGTAYVPTPVAPFVANKPFAMLIAMLISFVAALIPTLIFNRAAKRAPAGETEA